MILANRHSSSVRSTIIFLIVGLTIFIFSAGCRFWQKESQSIRIGEIVSLTGTESSYGESAHNGITLATDEINKNGGLFNLQVELITKDTKSQKETTVHVTRELIKTHNVVAILGEVASERTREAAAIAQMNQIPLVTPASTNPTITEVGDFIFRTCFIDPFQGYAMAKFAYNNLKIKKVAVLRDGRSNYSSGLAEYFIDEFTKLGGSITADEDYSVSESDFRPALRRIKDSKPQALFIPGYYTQVEQITRQAQEIGFRTQLLGGDGWDTPEAISSAAEQLRGSYIVSHFSSEAKDPRSLHFIEAYTAKYKRAPDGVAALAYDAAHILFYAIQQAGSTNNRDIQQALKKIKNYPSATGLISINKTRDAHKTAFILRIDKDKTTYVTSIDP